MHYHRLSQGRKEPETGGGTEVQAKWQFRPSLACATTKEMVLTLSNMLLLLTLLILFVAMATNRRPVRNQTHPECFVDDTQCTMHMNARCAALPDRTGHVICKSIAKISIAPIIDDKSIALAWTTMNSSADTSEYEGPPSYSREQAWERFEEGM